MDCRLRITNYGLGIKHGLGYKTRTKHYGLGIKYGLRYKTRTEHYGLLLNTRKGSTMNKFSHERFYQWKLPVIIIKFPYNAHSDWLKQRTLSEYKGQVNDIKLAFKFLLRISTNLT